MRSRAKIIGIAFLFATVAFVGWLVFRPNPLKAGAQAMVNAMRDGDREGLYRAASFSEIECSNLTADKLHGAWKLLVEPRIKSSKFVRAEGPEQSSNEYQATSSIWYTDKFGNPWGMVMIANRTDDGPKATVLIHMLLLAARFDAQERASASTSSETILQGVNRYRRPLEELGIHRIMLNPQRCLTWAEFEKVLLSRAAARSRRESDERGNSK